jgi:hypothetical protein
MTPENVPRRLKPQYQQRTYGTAEAVPLTKLLLTAPLAGVVALSEMDCASIRQVKTGERGIVESLALWRGEEAFRQHRRIDRHHEA